jgi:YfiH family protein
MRAAEADGLRFYQFASLDAANVAQAMFTRHGGVSPAPYATLNMSISTGDSRENVRANRTQAFQALQRDPASLADLWQVHSADVVVADRPNAGREHQGQADCLITDRPEVTLFLRFADCVPILLYDPRRPAVGLVHAGWRGTLLKAAAAAVQAMAERYGSRPADLVAAIGPSIGPCHYTVGPEVAEQTRAAFGSHAEELVERANGSYRLDLWAANAHCLRASGVEQIEVAGLCTQCHADEFYSHRAHGSRTGRFGALIGLR